MEPAGADVRVANEGARRPSGLAITAILLLLAAVGWWWSVRMAGDMTATDGRWIGMDGMDGCPWKAWRR